MYEWKTRVRYSEVDSLNRLTPAALVDYFQDCTNFEAIELGVGLDWLTARKLGWIILKWKIKIYRMPTMGENITVATFPTSFRGFSGQRNFIMKDEAGEKLATADSLWMLIETEGKTTVKIPEELSGAYTVLPKLDEEFDIKRISIPENSVSEEEFSIGYQNLDTNGHVNNGEYIRLALGYVPKEAVIKGIKVEYRNQAFLGDRIIPKKAISDKDCIISFMNEEDIPYAVLDFETEEP